MAYGFLSDKNAITYENFLFEFKRILVINNITVNIIEVLIDFEMAMINAIKVVFPLVHIRGCYFHFSKAIYRNIQDYGLANVYRISRSFKFWINMVSVLPLVPLSSLPAACLLCNSLKPVNNNLVDNLNNYLINTWFSKIQFLLLKFGVMRTTLVIGPIIMLKVFILNLTEFVKNHIRLFLM